MTFTFRVLIVVLTIITAIVSAYAYLTGQS